MLFVDDDEKGRRRHDEDSSAVSLWDLLLALYQAISFDPYSIIRTQKSPLVQATVKSSQSSEGIEVCAS